MLVVLHQQIARGTAGEDLDPAHPAAEFQLRQLRNVGLRPAHVQPDITPGLALDVFLLPAPAFRHRRSRAPCSAYRTPPPARRARQHGCRWGWSPPPCRPGRADARADRSGRADVQPPRIDRAFGSRVGPDAERHDPAVRTPTSVASTPQGSTQVPWRINRSKWAGMARFLCLSQHSTGTS